MRLKFPISIVVMYCVMLVMSECVPSNQGLGPVTIDDTQEYTETFLETYRQQVEEYFRFEYRKYFDFYANFPYKARATVSDTHGAAIEFEPSNESLLYFRTTEQRIEMAVFPDVDLNMTSLDINATVFIWHGEPSHATFVVNGTGVLSNIICITNKGHFLDLGIGGSLLLLNMNVDGRFYYVMMIKGNNMISSWAEDKAEEEAIKLFEQDLFHAFNQSAEIRRYMAYPILEKLISQIVWKHQHAEEIGYDMLQYYEDLTRIRDLAVTKYHLNSTFVDEILSWLEDIYPKPPEPEWWKIAPYSWILGTIVGVPLTLLLERVIRRAYKSLKRRWRSWRAHRNRNPL